MRYVCGLLMLLLTGCLGGSDSDIRGSAESAYAKWVKLHFDNTSNPFSYADQDTDGDGLKNLLEFALGTDPNVPSLGASPEFTVEGGTTIKGVLKLKNLVDLDVDVEVSSDMVNWSSGPGHVSTNTTAIDSASYELAAMDNVAIASSDSKKRFMRVRVSLRNHESVEAVSPVFGASLIDILGGPDGAADNNLAFNKTRKPVYQGRIQSVSSSTITVEGVPEWSDDAFVYSEGVQPDHYYLRINEGFFEGRTFEVLDNGADSLTLDVPSDVTFDSGTAISLIPHWSIGKAFEGSDGIVPSTGTWAFHLKTGVLAFDDSQNGINLSATSSFYYYNESWKKFGQGLTMFDDVILDPRLPILIRTKSDFEGDSTHLLAGFVYDGAVRLPIRVREAGAQESFVNLQQHKELSLNQSGLIDSGIFSASADFNAPTDTVRIWDTSVRTINPTRMTFFYHNGAWRKVGADETEDFGGLPLLQPHSGFMINKAAGNSDETLIWAFDPSDIE